MIDFILSFFSLDWTELSFMRNALLALIAIAPVCGIIGTMAVNNKMSFYADSIGHSALLGIGAGAAAGLTDHTLSLIVFAVIFSVLLVFIKNYTKSSFDVVLAVITSTAVAAGIILLSHNSGFAKFTRFLIGDILSVSENEIIRLFLILAVFFLLWSFLYNRFLIVSINPSIARSRGINVFVYEIIFAVIVAVVTALLIPWIGILLVSSLIVLPAAAARNISRGAAMYQLLSVAVALTASLLGLHLSFIWNSSTGAMIILSASFFYFATLILKFLKSKLQLH